MGESYWSGYVVGFRIDLLRLVSGSEYRTSGFARTRGRDPALRYEEKLPCALLVRSTNRWRLPTTSVSDWGSGSTSVHTAGVYRAFEPGRLLSA
jgi:hypothetical protein